MTLDRRLLDETHSRLAKALLAERDPSGHWAGSLSSSALSTATAVFALHLADPDKHKTLITNGLDWLARNQNPDGGWGDTVKSKSNISTTMLVWSAFSAAPQDHPYEQTLARTEAWLGDQAGSLEPDRLVQAIYENYGSDHTFSVPILTMSALAGRLGAEPWRFVKPLPFELAALPNRLFKWLNLNVVSYALPALITIGQVIYHNNPPKNPVANLLRRITRDKTLNTLRRIQPHNGGFLEAAPLTSFVTMSLIAAGQSASPVVERAIGFLTDSVRPDGSWPIDTDLATWLTTLSVNALAHSDPAVQPLDDNSRATIHNWLTSQQYATEHPYTHSAPGGWAWTDLPGAVPDADDTAGAIIALHNLRIRDARTTGSAFAAVKWLLDLQNRDGGIPTFCSGWGKLPFDRSAPDLTAHAITAWSLWLDELPAPAAKKTDRAIRKALRYLRQSQSADGSWMPLWFGNESAPNMENPLYGTARVLIGLASLSASYVEDSVEMIRKALRWLLSVQNTDGGFGGDKSVESSIEETALALDAMASVLTASARSGCLLELTHSPDFRTSIERSADWLVHNITDPRQLPPAPIGLYFARLWYFEKLYPLIFSLSALGRLAAATV
jgi:squalene-hopene/tetraprenyl-beta-curcumene cyclase